ncbi:UDP-glucuronosyltransferase 2B31-like isoform X3 [Pseudorasbora parva]
MYLGHCSPDHTALIQRHKHFSMICGTIFVLVLLCGVEAGRVLVLPGEYSHWHNMRTIVDALVEKNHSVTVLVSSSSPTVQHTRKERFNYNVFKANMQKEEASAIWSEFIHLWMNDTVTTYERFSMIRQVMSDFMELVTDTCKGMLHNEDLLHTLQESHYDVLLSDPMMPCADLMAEMLKIPHVLSLRSTFAYTFEQFCGQLPTPPSYVPAVAVQDHLTDHMSFTERVKNMLLYIMYTSLFRVNMRFTYDQLYTEIWGKPTTMCETMGKADIWLIRTYWDFEYPRPLLPNFKFVGGLHCKPAKPLSKELEKFVQSSGDHGVVVFSLGSMINNLTMERANTVASALGQIPQKVLWRYSGKTPETLAPNTKLYDWMPQNDLLGHPKTKVFITHGGTNGLYEAIYHGVPMVGLPLFADQPDNMMHMKTKGAAVVLDINTMESKDLADALKTVLNNLS